MVLLVEASSSVVPLCLLVTTLKCRNHLSTKRCQHWRNGLFAAVSWRLWKVLLGLSVCLYRLAC